MINFESINTIIILSEKIKPLNITVSFYFKVFAIKRVLQYINTVFKIPNFKQIDQRITQLRNDVDEIKRQNILKFKTQEEDLKIIENSTLSLFFEIDDLERQGQKELFNEFMFAYISFSLLNFFIPQRPDFKEKKYYCAFKALEQQQFIKQEFNTIKSQKPNYILFDFQESILQKGHLRYDCQGKAIIITSHKRARFQTSKEIETIDK
ncbi:hypothetical protein pb186bvf_017290 [Paramecium bursaria]